MIRLQLLLALIDNETLNEHHTAVMNSITFFSLFMRHSGRRNISISLLFLFVILIFFIPRIEYRSEITDYFPPDHPQIVEFNQLELNFGKQDNFLVLLDFGHREALTADALNILLSIVKDIEKVPGVQSVRSLLDFSINMPTDDGWETQSLYRLLDRNPHLLRHAEGQLADSLRASSAWLSVNRHVTNLQISFTGSPQGTKAYQHVVHLLESNKAINAFRFGPLEIRQELQRSLMHDGLQLMPLVMLTGILLMWIFLRSWWLIAAGIGAILLSLLMTAGVVGLLGMAVNQTSVLAFGIVFIVVLAEVIHVLMGYLYACQQLDKHEAMNSSLGHNIGSLFLTSFTTFLGFISLNISNSPAFAVFGNIASIGVCFAFVATVTLLPTLCLWAPKPKISPVADRLQHALGHLSQLPLRHPMISLALVLLLTVACLPGNWRNYFQNDPLDYFHPSTKIYQATHELETQFNVKHHVTILITSEGQDSALSANTLDTISHFRQWSETQPDITYMLGYDTVLERLQGNLHENDPRWVQLPTQGAAIAELINLYQMASPHNSLRSLGFNADASQVVVTLGIPPLSSHDTYALEQRIKQWFNDNAPQLNASVTGHAPLFASIGLSLTRNMVFGDITTVAVITLVMMWGLRSVKLGIISLIPNIVPPAVIYGVWGYLSGKIDVAAAGAFSMGMGIIVDDTIHIMRNYVIFRRAGHDTDESLRLTFLHSGPALVLTTLVLSAGLGVLCLAKFGPNQVTAQLMASTIALALVYDLCLLPLVLKWTDRVSFGITLPTKSVLTVETLRQS